MRLAFVCSLIIGVLAVPQAGMLAAGQPTSSSQERPKGPINPEDRGAAPGRADSVATADSSAMNELYASQLIGMTVKNAQGENLGKIDELVIEPKSARIKAAVVSVGGVLGIGAKSVAVPWDKVVLGSGADRDTVVVSMGKEELEQAPGWQKSER